MHDRSPTRRRVIGGITALGVGSFLGAQPFRAVHAVQMTAGFIYIGPRDDWGWNHSFGIAAQALAALPNVMVVEAAYLPESTDYSDGKETPETKAYNEQLVSLIKPDGARMVFSSSVGTDPFLYAVARKHPEVVFRNVTDFADDATPPNVGSQNALIYQGHYVNGVAAGLCTRSNKLGFVAGEALGSVLLNVNSFLLGSRKTNPKATVHLVVTGGWESADREAAATNKLIDEGCDVIACHLDSPKVVIETAEARGVKTCGHAINQAPLAPRGYITGAEYVWTKVFTMFVETLQKGGSLPRFVTGGYDKGYVTSSPFGAGANAQAIEAANGAIQAMKNGTPIFAGPLKDNAGQVVVPAGKSYGPYAPALQKTDYLVEGVVGSVKLGKE
ncbi:MAG: BMP family ABC transporter substrate-binding protein [Methyloceanibacter sp.]|nr:BMP family ABC transporter substrate-binding protein [Methyloceanibacter sp.]